MSNVSKLYSLFLYLVTVGVIMYFSRKWGKKKGNFYKTSRVFFGFVLAIMSLWILSVFVQTLGSLVAVIGLVLLPILFLLFSLFLIFYGITAIINQETFVKLFGILPPVKLRGISSIYFGIIFVITGVFVLLATIDVLGLFFCEDHSIFCEVSLLIDRVLPFVGSLLRILSIR